MKKLRQMQALAALAQLRADQELRRFAALGVHVAATRAIVNGMRDELQQAVSENVPISVDEMRLTMAVVGYRADALFRAERDLERMLPGYELARARAAREYGRARAMDEVATRTTHAARQARLSARDG